jgi:hypothetical protein
MNKSINGGLTCVIVGQTYALKSIRLFLDSVKKYVEENNLQIKINYYGGSSLAEIDLKIYKDFIVNRGWIHPNQIVEEIKNYDFAFLPYFDTDNQIVGEMSFPSKMIVYSSARLPILYVGLEKSSPAALISKYNIGFVFSQSKFEKNFSYTNLHEIYKLKESVDFKRNMEELNKKVFSRNNFRDTLLKLDILSEKKQSNKPSKIIGSKNNVSELYYSNSERDSLFKVNLRSKRFLFTLNRINNTLNMKNFSDVSGNSFSDVSGNSYFNIVFIQNADGQVSYQIKQSAYLGSSSFKHKSFTFSIIDKNHITSITELVVDNNVILTLNEFAKIQGNMSLNGFNTVLRTISPKTSDLTIISKKFVQGFNFLKKRKVIIKNHATIADFYILSLLGNLNVTVSGRKLNDLLLQNARDSENQIISVRQVMFNVFDLLDLFHIHDPFQKSLFNVKAESEVNNFSIDELKEIYQNTLTLDSKNVDSGKVKERKVERFIGLLYLLGKNENEVRDFIINHIEYDKSDINSLLLLSKPFYRLGVFKTYIL